MAFFDFLAENILPWILLSANIVLDIWTKIPIASPFDCIIMLGFVSTYRKQLARVFKLYQENPPIVGRRAVDVKPFRVFLKGYVTDCYWNMLTAVAIILANTVNLNIAAVQIDLQKYFVLQVLVVVSMTHALASLYLSLLYMDTLVQVNMSYAYTLIWLEGAMSVSSARWLSSPVVLAMPSAWSAGAIISFAAYRIASGLIWMLDEDGTAFASKDDANQYAALAVVCYMGFIIVQTALAGRIFVGFKDSVVTPRLR